MDLKIFLLVFFASVLLIGCTTQTGTGNGKPENNAAQTLGNQAAPSVPTKVIAPVVDVPVVVPETTTPTITARSAILDEHMQESVVDLKSLQISS